MNHGRRHNDAGAKEAGVSLTSRYRELSRDPVTGLLNGEAMLAIADFELERARRTESETTIVFIYQPEPERELSGDLRGTKQVARFLRNSLRGEDAVSRIGRGFVLLLPDTGLEAGEQVGRQLAEGLANTTGIGVPGRWSFHAEANLPGDDGREIIERATAAVPGLARDELRRFRRRSFRARVGRR